MAATRCWAAHEHARLPGCRSLCRSWSNHRSEYNTGHRICCLRCRLPGCGRYYEGRGQYSRPEYRGHVLVLCRSRGLCRFRRDAGCGFCDNSSAWGKLRAAAHWSIHRSAFACTYKREIFYRVRLICEAEHRVEVERQVTRAIAERSLILRELATEEFEETATTLVQTVVESSTRDRALLNRLVEELRALPMG